jgi:hypothetical protein
MILALGLLGCGSAQGPADGAPKITARTGMRDRPQHAARPVAVKLGSTFEVRVKVPPTAASERRRDRRWR